MRLKRVRLDAGLLLVLAVGLGCPINLGPLMAQEPTTNQTESLEQRSKRGGGGSLEADVAEWVDELDADRLTTRKAAEQALIDAGPEVLRLLPVSTDHLSAEASLRLSRVRGVLRATQAESNIAARQILLDDVSTLGEALEIITRDSGVGLSQSVNESLPVDPVKVPLPFWQALDHVLDEADLDIDFYGADQGALRLVSREQRRPSRLDSAAYAGVYRIEPTSVTARRVLNNPGLSGLNIGVEIAWEPRLTPIGLTLPVDQLTGKLDDGEKLVPQESSNKIDVATSSDLAFSEFFLPMQLPSGRPRSIESLSGVIQAMLPGEVQTFRIPLAKRAAQKRQGAMTVELEQVRPSGPLHEVRVGIELEDAKNALESHRHWIFENEVYLERDDGVRVDHLGYQVFRQSSDGVGVGYLFDIGESLQDATLVYKSPTSVVQNEVPFVLQDIPLP